MYGFPAVKIEARFFPRFYYGECIAKSKRTIETQNAVKSTVYYLGNTTTLATGG